MPIKGENAWKFAASILLFLSGVGPAFGQAEMKSFLFLQNDYPVFISTDGKKLNEQIMYLSADDEYVRLHYTFCETAKEAPALNASRELNKAAVYGGHCDYQILSAPVGDLTNVSLLCSVRTGEIIAASSPEGVSGLSQAVDWSPMKKTPAECPVVGTGCYKNSHRSPNKI